MRWSQTYIGAPIRRREDFRLLTGQATFADDIKLPHMLHAAILRSPHAHARLTAIDATRALAIPGVVTVFTFQDIAPLAKPIPVRLYPLPGLEQFLQYPLARDRVRYVGEPVAVVVAESRYLAEDGLDAMDVTYEPLPAVTDVRQSLQQQVIIHEEPGTNLAARYTLALGDIEEAFGSAAYRRKEVFKVHRHTGNPLETRGLVASYDAVRGEFTVWGETKVPHFNRAILASFLGVPESTIHFIEPDVGGGFGIRGEFYPEDFLIPFAAMKLGRPVKWIEDRLEHLKAANHSRDVLCEVEIAAQRDGTLLGMQAHVYGDMGAYIRTHGGLVPSSTAALLTGPYHIPAYQVTVSCVMTNKMGLGTYRAPGRYESCFIRERLLDMVADDLAHRSGGAALEKFHPALGDALHRGQDTSGWTADRVRQWQLSQCFPACPGPDRLRHIETPAGEAAGWEVPRHRHRMFCEEHRAGSVRGGESSGKRRQSRSPCIWVSRRWGRAMRRPWRRFVPTRWECPRKPLRFFMAAPT